jgi:hypothetical protein
MNNADHITKLVNTQKSSLIDPIAWKQIKGMAETLILSKALPQYIKNKEQAIVVMQAGHEMGMKPMESLNSLYLVNGQITIWGKAITKQFVKHGYKLSYKDRNNETMVTATKGSDVFNESMTFKEAELSGYTKDNSGRLKFGWKEGSNRILKLRYGSLNKLAKTQCAEVLDSAVGVTEVYQDSETPSEYQEAEIVTNEIMLDADLIKKINLTKDQKELIKTCVNIKAEINADYYDSLEIEYARRKKEILNENEVK